MHKYYSLMSLKMGGRWELGIRSEELGMFVGGGGFVSGMVGVGEWGFYPLFDGWGAGVGL